MKLGNGITRGKSSYRRLRIKDIFKSFVHHQICKFNFITPINMNIHTIRPILDRGSTTAITYCYADDQLEVVVSLKHEISILQVVFLF